MNSEKGELVCEFRLWDMQYCVQRMITKTKKGESVSSKLWTKPFETWQIEYSEIVEYGSISPFELPSGYTIFDFKNETDLQKNLDEILPPKEVFLGTYFLLQDSDNIFELPPRERLEIFKHVFGLLGIDESKDKIAEEKREIGAIIKSRMDTTQYDTKLQWLLDRLILLRAKIQSQQDRYQQDPEIFSAWNAFVSEQHLLQGKIVIENLALPTVLDIWGLRSTILSHQQRHTELQTQSRSLHQHITTLRTQLQSLQTQLSQKAKESDSIQVQLDRYSDNVFVDLTHNLHKKQTERNQYMEACSIEQDIKIIKELLPTIVSSELQSAGQILLSESEANLHHLRSFLQEAISVGKDIKYKLSLQEEKKTNIAQTIKDLDIQIIQSEHTLKEFEQTINAQQQFHCDKISGSCPYIEMINTATFKNLRNQLDTMILAHTNLKTQKEQRLEEQTTLLSDSNFSELEKDAESVKKLLISSQRKLREEQIQTLAKIDAELYSLQSQRSQLQQQQAKTLDLRQQLITLQSESQSLKNQIADIQNTIISSEQEQDTLQMQIQQLISVSVLDEDLKYISEYEQVVDRLSLLLWEFKDNQLLIKQLKEKEKILSDLYLVFSKELLLIVVQSNLPQIQDLMNMYLSQVVDYQLVMEIDKKSTSTESLELFVTVQDRYGTREVSALSWGQKVILKLVWMMAISVITNSQMLFLDETINNLDGDTVAKVAELLKNFIKGKGEQFQFYVVTHSHQIQDMDIWNGVIEIGK